MSFLFTFILPTAKIEASKSGGGSHGQAHISCGCEQCVFVLGGSPAGGQEVGFALFFHNFSTFLGRAGIYLEDLYVKPEYRGRGYGKGLLKQLAKIALERGCGRLEWWCLDWNQLSIDFYLSLGAEPMQDWTVYRITGQTLSDLAQ